MRNRRPGQAVNVCACANRPVTELVEQLSGGHLADVLDFAGIRPRRSEPLREHARRQSDVAHADQHRALVRPECAAQLEQRDAVAQPARLGRDLHDRGTAGAHGARPLGEVVRHAVEVVRRENDAPGMRRHDIREIGPPFHVDEVGPELERLLEQPSAFMLRAPETAAFPGGTTGNDDRQPAPGERTGHVRVADAIEPQLNDVGVGHEVPMTAQFGHRACCHGDAEKWFRSHGSKKKASSTGG